MPSAANGLSAFFAVPAAALWSSGSVKALRASSLMTCPSGFLPRRASSLAASSTSSEMSRVVRMSSSF